MKIAIITRSMSPIHCGIGDHSQKLKDVLCAYKHNVIVVAGRGKAVEGGVFILEDDWSYKTLSELMNKLEKLEIDQLILQYTPLLYYTDSIFSLSNINKFWKECGIRWKTNIILHETYFKAWWYPSSIIRGVIQKYFMKDLVKSSHKIFTASQPLKKEVNSWDSNYCTEIMPIGSNIDICPVDREKVRNSMKIRQKEIVITLFGGGTSLKWLKHYVNYVDQYLSKNKVNIQWLFLGGVPIKWFRIKSPVHCLGWLSPEELSKHLQISDIFLVPHIRGTCAKRGTIMTAMQHGLPIVGTKGVMTDNFLSNVKGLSLVPLGNPKRFSDSVLKLARDINLRKENGRHNSNYFNENFTWEKIAEKFLTSIK